MNEDPFKRPADAGATVIRPVPGGRRPGTTTESSQGAPPLPNQRPVVGRQPGLGEDDAMGRLTMATPRISNPLVGCATGLLTLAAELRGAPFHPDPGGLREGLIQKVRDFETCARAKGLVDSVVLPARYVLCALLDESILDTPWGAQSIWARQGLLVSFHNETWGGEKFFTALERLLAYPSGNLNLLELMYLCLALGFEGRYRTRAEGRAQLERVREQLFQAIRGQRGDPDPELSSRWRGVEMRRDPLLQQVPLWVFSAVSALLLLALFSVFSFSLNRHSDPVYLALSRLDQGLSVQVERPREPFVQTPPPVRPLPEAPAPLTLRLLLAEEIAAGRLEVIDRPEGQTVIIQGDSLFASASSRVAPDVEPLLRRIGEAMARLPGAILVTGHSDSIPIKTLRFPSNWHLSQERADRVAQLIGETVGNPERIRAEGRADTEPRVPENPRDARNRRVEITLLQASDRRVSAGEIAGVGL